jgi:hypothetical protein
MPKVATLRNDRHTKKMPYAAGIRNDASTADFGRSDDEGHVSSRSTRRGNGEACQKCRISKRKV